MLQAMIDEEWQTFETWNIPCDAESYRFMKPDGTVYGVYSNADEACQAQYKFNKRTSLRNGISYGKDGQIR